LVGSLPLIPLAKLKGALEIFFSMFDSIEVIFTCHDIMEPLKIHEITTKIHGFLNHIISQKNLFFLFNFDQNVILDKFILTQPFWPIVFMIFFIN
jgi:hypothetical protein